MQARATRITIYEHANPPSAAGFVRSVTLVAPSGATHVVWSGVDMTGCGGALTVRCRDTRSAPRNTPSALP